MTAWATGGTETSYESGGTTYYVHTFTTGANFEVLQGPLTVSYLVVAGGGGGGGATAADGAAGGGGGGVRTGSTALAEAVHTITVGAGGAGGANTGAVGSDGGASSIGATVVTVGGGGGGGTASKPGRTGGSGGGAYQANTVGAGTSGEGFDGGTGYTGASSAERSGGGGGGKSEVGADGTLGQGGDGGEGASSSINNSATVYGSGGGGGVRNTAAGTGGTGGTSAGNGGKDSAGAAASPANRGCGGGAGGGGAAVGYAGGDGSAGIVIISYVAPGPTADPAWDFLRQITEAYADLPGDAGWGPKAWLPGTLADNDWIEVRATGTTTITDFTELGLLSFTGTTPYTFDYRLWDGDSWGSAVAVEVDLDAFSGIMRDFFTGADDTTIDARAPDDGTGTWTVDKFRPSGADPAGLITIQTNRFSANSGNGGASFDAGTTDLDLYVQWHTGSGSDNVGVIAFRRTDDNNQLVIQLNQTTSLVRLLRYVGGSYTEVATSALTLSSSAIYLVRIYAVANLVRCWVNEVEYINETVTTNQGATDTNVGLYAATSDLPVVFDAIEVYSGVATLPIQASTDAAEYSTGATIGIQLHPDDSEAPNGLTLDSINVFADFTASGLTGGSLAAPSTAAFLPAGAFNAVPWFTDLDLVVQFASSADSTIQISFTGPDGANVSGSTDWGGVIGASPAGFLTGYTEGDLWYLTAPANDIDSIDNGVITPLAAVGALNLYIYTAGAWTDEGPVLIQLGTIASRTVRVGQAVTITPVFAGNDGDAVFTIQSGSLPPGLTIDAGTGVISGTVL